MAALEDLDSAFSLPAAVCSDQRLRELYEVLVARMRSEAQHLPMNTVQQLLIERIAFNYIVLRLREGHPLGSEAGFASASIHKDFNTFWLSMTREFNAMLSHGDKVDREAIMREVRDLIMQTLVSVEDSSIKRDLIDKFANSFQQAGL